MKISFITGLKKAWQVIITLFIQTYYTGCSVYIPNLPTEPFPSSLSLLLGRESSFPLNLIQTRPCQLKVSDDSHLSQCHAVFVGKGRCSVLCRNFPALMVIFRVVLCFYGEECSSLRCCFFFLPFSYVSLRRLLACNAVNINIMEGHMMEVL